MFLISTEDKTPQQISKESWKAFQKFQKMAKQEVESKNKSTILSVKNNQKQNNDKK